MKKNVSPLRQLKKAIDETPRVTLKRLRVLVIDDECDQASVNSAGNELDMTAINACIRELLSMFPAVSYVGYTATPFANVLISPYLGNAEEPDDLYPRDFITALPKPPGYFGAEELFGRPPADAANPDPDEEGLDMIRVIPAEDEQRLQPESAGDRVVFQPRMAASLGRRDPLFSSLLCRPARAWRRGQTYDDARAYLSVCEYARTGCGCN